MAEFSENRHISNLINMSCKVLISKILDTRYKVKSYQPRKINVEIRELQP